ncbi:MAG: hypothetical protein AAF203_09520, partial [Pseudomonadota bacterium]
IEQKLFSQYNGSMSVTLPWLHVGACLFMTGVIWIVQWVHYPSFAFVSQEQFFAFNQFHQKAITHIVAPMMVFELFSGLYLAYSAQWSPVHLVLLALIGLIWASTFFLSVPLHSLLIEKGFDLDVIQKLVATNWPRTILWSVRSMILLFLVKL